MLYHTFKFEGNAPLLKENLLKLLRGWIRCLDKEKCQTSKRSDRHNSWYLKLWKQSLVKKEAPTMRHADKIGMSKKLKAKQQTSL